MPNSHLFITPSSLQPVGVLLVEELEDHVVECGEDGAGVAEVERHLDGVGVAGRGDEAEGGAVVLRAAVLQQPAVHALLLLAPATSHGAEHDLHQERTHLDYVGGGRAAKGLDQART